MKKRIYLDYAAATPARKEVVQSMKRFWSDDFGNAGAVYKEGMIAKEALEKSRQTIAEIIKARSDEIIFNSGGAEANNSAIFGLLDKLNEDGTPFDEMRIITTVIEHPSVLERVKYFEKKGVEVDYLQIGQDGIIDLKQFKKFLKLNTVLVSIMFVNNEIGSIQPISEVAKIIRAFKKKRGDQNSVLPIFHSDAAQALLYLSVNTQKIGVDLMSFDAQKIYGPKGIGVLYIKKGVEINPLLIGGKQERELRSGTENIPLIVGFAKALELANKERDKEVARLTKLRNYFIEQILGKIPGTELNGALKNRLPNNVNLSFPNINNEFMVIQLDEKGIACSTKTACSNGTFSYVIASLGKNKNKIKGSLRFTLGRQTSKTDIIYVIKHLIKICGK